MATVEFSSQAVPQWTSPEAPSIDHSVLADEVRRSESRIKYMDARRTVRTLLLDSQAIGEALISHSLSGVRPYPYHVRSAKIESVETNPGRDHLALLIAARGTIVAKPYLVELKVGGDLHTATAATGIEPHLPGWELEETIQDTPGGALPSFSFYRRNLAPGIPQYETIGIDNQYKWQSMSKQPRPLPS